jgi:hypothetical protein
MNQNNIESREYTEEYTVTLDCESVVLPTGRNSLLSVRAYLEFLALSGQRILSDFVVDGIPFDLSLPPDNRPFRRVDAVTIPLTELPLLLLATAGQQVCRARCSVENALTLVLINNPEQARELWWSLAGQLKEPVLTLSLMPEHLCELWCGVTFAKLRRWQLEQVSLLVRRVDEACEDEDNIQLSDALEKQVLPWLDKLGEHIRLWHSAALAGTRMGAGKGGGSR